MKSFIFILLIFSLAVSQNSYDYDNMKEDMYNTELKKWRDMLSNAESEITRIDGEMSTLSGELTNLDSETENIWNQIYAAVGMDKAGFEAYMAEINQLRSDVQAFNSLSSEEAYKRRKEIDAFQKRHDTLKANKASALTQAENALTSIQSMINSARAKATLPNSMYQVVRGDYLWKIAGKSDVYGDPYGWTWLYNNNKSLIKDPNLIFPNQIFSVARAVDANQYLVKKGDSLSKIANSYGSAFKWTSLYESNKSIVEDQNVIYPYQVLTIPNN